MIGSILGLFLRWQFISPTTGINYTFVLHGHSHIMFLGWIFNALYIGFTLNHIDENEQKIFLNLFYAMQLFTAGMLISFPLQGYGAFSIILSTLHTIAAIVFVIMFFNKTKNISSVSGWYARVSLVMFTVSTAGPFFLGYLMANGMGQSHWYYFSIYFYLHFQYNGFFLLGVISLILNLLERKNIHVNVRSAKLIGMILVIACVPAYLLSTLWARPAVIFNIVGGAAALMQLIAAPLMIKLILPVRDEIRMKFSRLSCGFLIFVFIVFAVKLILQLCSAHPFIARMAYELRPIVIAYLHLVLLGVISLSLFVWYLESNFVVEKAARNSMLAFLFSFLGMEACLILTPWWSVVLGPDFYSSTTCTFVFSAILSGSCLWLYLSSRGKLTKISI